MTRVDATNDGCLLIVSEGAVSDIAFQESLVDTLAGLRSRLRQHLIPVLELAEPIAVRLALAKVVPPLALGDPWLGPIAKRGGRAWLGVVDAVDAAISVVRDRGDALENVAGGEDATARRAAFLFDVIDALD